MPKLSNDVRVSKPFVRVAPTTLYLAPACYGDYDKVIRPVDVGLPSSEDQCALCSVRSQCRDGLQVEMKAIEDANLRILTNETILKCIRCEEEVSLVDPSKIGYRCYYCGEVFCTHCAGKHFREEKHD